MDIDALLARRDIVTADFVAVVPVGERVAVFIGDAPAAGLKSAFVVRFMTSLVMKQVQTHGVDRLRAFVDDLRALLRAQPAFERITMFVAVLDPREEKMTMVNAGHIFPVLYSAGCERAERLRVRGDVLTADAGAEGAWNEERHVDLNEGDAIVFVTDGVTEAARLDDPYGYRLTSLLERQKHWTARELTEAILGEWSAHPRPIGFLDDAAIVTAVVRRGQHR